MERRQYAGEPCTTCGSMTVLELKRECTTCQQRQPHPAVRVRPAGWPADLAQYIETPRIRRAS